MARIFLYIVAGVITLVIIAAILYRTFDDELARLAFVPTKSYEETELPPPPDYGDADAWAAFSTEESRVFERPEGVDAPADLPAVDIFFVHPTTYLEKDYWNAPINETTSSQRVENSIMMNQAGAFNAAGDRIYAPRYRQAAFGAFLDETGDGVKALITAYQDVSRAFAHYAKTQNQGRPFILAGHSQGALHALFLLRDQIAGTPLEDRLVAAYIVGWPVSVEADLDALANITACEGPDETGCVVSWQSFTSGGDPTDILEGFAIMPGLSGALKGGTTMLCTNPITWLRDGQTAPASAHLGKVPLAPSTGRLEPPEPASLSAGCGPDGILYVSPRPGDGFDTFVLPGDNYHVYDINLFYMDVRANARARALAFTSALN